MRSTDMSLMSPPLARVDAAPPSRDLVAPKPVEAWPLLVLEGPLCCRGSTFFTPLSPPGRRPRRRHTSSRWDGSMSSSVIGRREVSAVLKLLLLTCEGKGMDE